MIVTSFVCDGCKQPIDPERIMFVQNTGGNVVPFRFSYTDPLGYDLHMCSSECVVMTSSTSSRTTDGKGATT